ncbi:MAG TPA: FAD-dependent oxidoreductase [Pyrinomonadaceae bacterium]|nr:FAD-dependent oxidoreductase [Pyrinomonadaceae bacterium]
MANVVIVGGGFSGIVAAESLVKKLGSEHEITLVSRSRKFVFYPALVRLAFAQSNHDNIEFDVREALRDRKIRFVEGEVARIHPAGRHITLVHGDFVGDMHCDFLVIALGRRLRTERIPGFFEHAHHLLGISDAEKFGAAARVFNQGSAVIGHCDGARLPVPLFETAFALSQLLKERGKRDQCKITIVSSEKPDEMFGGIPMSQALKSALESHRIELISDFAITQVTPNSFVAKDGRCLSYDLNMVIPPFGGPGALVGTGLTDSEGYVSVDEKMRVEGLERVYAAGDCVSFKGPKLGHMAVRQAEIVAENVAAEIQGRAPETNYDHEMMLVIDDGNESIFVQKDLWSDEPATIQQSRFWAWAKRKQEHYWKAKHA